MPSKSGTVRVTVSGTEFDNFINRKKFNKNFFNREVREIKEHFSKGNFIIAIKLIQNKLEKNNLSPHDRELLIRLANGSIGFLSDSYPDVAKQVISRSAERLFYITSYAYSIKKSQFVEKLSNNSIILSCVIKNCDTSNIERAKWAIAQAVYLKQSGKDVDMNAVAEAITYITRINRDNEEFLQKLLEECGENIRLILNEVTDGRIKVFVGGLTGSDAWKAWENSRTNQPQPTPTRSQNSAHNGSNNSQSQNLHASAHQHQQNTMRLKQSSSQIGTFKRSNSNIQSSQQQNNPVQQQPTPSPSSQQSVTFSDPVGTCSNIQEVENKINSNNLSDRQYKTLVEEALQQSQISKFQLSASLCVLGQLALKGHKIGDRARESITFLTRKNPNIIENLSDHDLYNIVCAFTDTKFEGTIRKFQGLVGNNYFLERISKMNDKEKAIIKERFDSIIKKYPNFFNDNIKKRAERYGVADIISGGRQVNTVSSSTSRSSGFNTRRSRLFDVNDICNSIESCSSVSELNEVLNRVQIPTNSVDKTLILNVITKKVKQLDLDGLSRESLIKILRIFARNNQKSFDESSFINLLENPNVQKIFDKILNIFDLENIMIIVSAIYNGYNRNSRRFSDFVNRLDSRISDATSEYIDHCMQTGEKFHRDFYNFLRNGYLSKGEVNKRLYQIIDKCLSNDNLSDEILLNHIKGIEFVFGCCSDSLSRDTFEKIIEFLRNDRIRNIIRKYGIDMNFFIHGIDKWCERLNIQSKEYIGEIEKFMKTPTVVQPKPKSQPVQPKHQPTPQQPAPTQQMQQQSSYNQQQSQNPFPPTQQRPQPQQPAPTQQMQQQSSYNQQQSQNPFPPTQQRPQPQQQRYQQQSYSNSQFANAPAQQYQQHGQQLNSADSRFSTYQSQQQNGYVPQQPQPQYQQSQQYQQQQQYQTPQMIGNNTPTPQATGQQPRGFGFNPQFADANTPQPQSYGAPTPQQPQPQNAQVFVNQTSQGQVSASRAATKYGVQQQAQQYKLDSKMFNQNSQQLQQFQQQNSYNQQQNQNAQVFVNQTSQTQVPTPQAASQQPGGFGSNSQVASASTQQQQPHNNHSTPTPQPAQQNPGNNNSQQQNLHALAGGNNSNTVKFKQSNAQVDFAILKGNLSWGGNSKYVNELCKLIRSCTSVDELNNASEFLKFRSLEEEELSPILDCILEKAYELNRRGEDLKKLDRLFLSMILFSSERIDFKQNPKLLNKLCYFLKNKRVKEAYNLFTNQEICICYDEEIMSFNEIMKKLQDEESKAVRQSSEVSRSKRSGSHVGRYLQGQSNPNRDSGVRI